MDDRAAVREQIARALTEQEFNVAQCSASEAFGSVASATADIVLLDYAPGEERTTDLLGSLSEGRLVILAAQLKNFSTLEIVKMVQSIAQHRYAPERHPHMTDRDRTTLIEVVNGLSNKEIAAKHEMSESAVKSTMQRLFRKTGTRTRSQLVRFALSDYLHRNERLAGRGSELERDQ